MSKLIRKLWSDDQGAILAAEYLFLATILVLGTIVGLTTVRTAITAELTELSNAYLALSQSYTISGLTGCCAAVQGSAAIDTPGGPLSGPICVADYIPSAIDVVLPCQ